MIKQENSQEKRFLELDIIRGGALVCMIIYHGYFDWQNFFAATDYVENPLWTLFARLTAVTFILVSGICFFISLNNAPKIFLKTLKKSLLLFFYASLVSVVTFIFVSAREFIIFGILHFFALAKILGLPALKLSNKINLFLAGLIIGGGVFLGNIAFSFPYFLWLGLIPQNFSSLDFFPLLPWFGVFLIGLVVGKTYYAESQLSLPVTNFYKNSFLKTLTLFGKNSLFIYLLHQPIILGALFLSTKIFN